MSLVQGGVACEEEMVSRTICLSDLCTNPYVDQVEKSTAGASHCVASHEAARGLELAPVVCDLAL